ncbi:Transposase DDE domain-containing protein [Halorubrum vacuolatum]|uniref:Transposase DDE domain-containing protein n=1 Tax=Halorubrum vacuolatum TaxID=63740 RepID=A0A238Y4J8_HALVU|nr:Transposase DDE domain-containing protein [Halorubrum vacuolatum]
MLFDLAYFKYRRFALIDENDGYFLSRLKQNANPPITGELREWRGRAIPLEGKQLRAVLDDLDRKYIDVEVEVEFKRGPYNGTQSVDTKRFRVVGVRNEDADDYHLYMTNLARKEFFPADLAEIYRCRWEVELLFRELKTQYELDEFDTSDEHVVRILLYAALLSLLVSRDLLDLVTEQADDELVFPTERWAATFRSHAQLILHELGEFLGYSPPPLLDRLIEDAQKIHKQRPILQETLATAIQPRCEAQLKTDACRQHYFFYNAARGNYYAASIILGTGRDKDRSFVNTIWPYDQPPKTYLVVTTRPISVELSERRFRNLFGYKINQDPLSGQKSRYLISPASNHQNEFERNISSYEEFFKSIRSSRDLDFDWVERKSQLMQEIARTWR